jgi:N-dimethylarginine dimethylaminohydrolase
MKHLMMCRPDYFDVSYEINHWMHDNIDKVDKTLAIQQWNKLYATLSEYATIKLIRSVNRMPDLVFTANAGIIQDGTAILSRFNTKERQQEEIPFHYWFLDNGYKSIQPKSKYEGEGDHLRDNLGRHWMGSGFRTEKDAGPELEKILDIKINVLELVDPRWYHLDTCFCPLPNGEIMWYPKAFSKKSQKLIRASFDEGIEVGLQDALLFCCNCICIGNDLFLPQHSDAIEDLELLHYNIHEFDLSEFLKAGGAAKCLVLYCDN